MFDMYKIIEGLCLENNITITQMCRDLKINRSSLSELKQGRAKSLSADKVVKIAKYFGVPAEYITDGQSDSSAFSVGKVSDEEIKFALFNGSEGITDEMFDEVKQFAEMVKLREDTKRKKAGDLYEKS
ncbi:MAG: helix-turn-helix domain-containing protein [Oscillospiraceae bacterium]